MTQKSTAKHTEKKPPELFPNAPTAKTLPALWLSAAQLFPYTGLDAPALRRRAIETNPATGAPWIPKPRGSRWPLHETLTGVLAWREHQLATATTRALPTQCATMQDVETIFRLPKEMQSYARAHHHPQTAAQVIFESSNRVNVLPMFEFFYPLLKKIFSGGGNKLQGLQGFEDLDLDLQRALSTKEDVIEKKRDNARANRDLYTMEGIERELGEPLTRIADDWRTALKTHGGKLKSLLHGAGMDTALIQQALAIFTEALHGPPAKLRQQLGLDQPNEPANQIPVK